MTLFAIKRPAAVLFDCDGVLADSEGLSNRVIAAEITSRGRAMTPEEAGRTFLGTALSDMKPMIEAMVGPLPGDWIEVIKARVTAVMAAEVEAMPGAGEVLRAVAAAGLPAAVASNSSHAELDAKLNRLGFATFFGGRIYSFEDVPRPKPWPDIYLAAAAACGAAPADCVVIEDSIPGVRAGIAAGARVLGFAHEFPPERMRAEGAQPFTAMAQLPALLGLVPAAA